MNNIDTQNITTNANETQIAKTVSENSLEINKENGMKFCMDSEEFYNEILAAFCSQSGKFIPQLAEYYDAKDWANYAIIAHSLKSNTRTIGADNFAELALKHELAGKAGDEEFITSDYENFIATLKALREKVQGMV